MADILQILREDEGLRLRPYRDSRNVLSIGYGTDIQEGITKEEADMLLRSRVEKTWTGLHLQWPPFDGVSPELRDALTLAAYQLGVSGLLKFKRMLQAIEKGDWDDAIREARNSQWFHQTPKRVQRLTDAFQAEKARSVAG